MVGRTSATDSAPSPIAASLLCPTRDMPAVMPPFLGLLGLQIIKSVICDLSRTQDEFDAMRGFDVAMSSGNWPGSCCLMETRRQTAHLTTAAACKGNQEKAIAIAEVRWEYLRDHDSCGFACFVHCRVSGHPRSVRSACQSSVYRRWRLGNRFWCR